MLTLGIQLLSGQWNSSPAQADPMAKLTQIDSSVESGYWRQSKTDESSSVAGIYLETGGSKRMKWLS